ncbi:MAG: DUF4360 domain-containing protein [Oligoflexus sp.]
MIKLSKVLGFVVGIIGFQSLGFGQSAPSFVNISRISYNGSGCPLGTVNENVSTDRQAFTLTFSEYAAEAGPTLALSAQRRNCQVTVDLNFPSGWSYSIVSIDYRGFAFLDRGVRGTHAASYYFQGQGQTARSSTTLRGFFNDSYFVRDVLGLNAVVWSPCGARRALNINSEVRVDNRFNRNAEGLMTVDSIDGQVIHTYNLAWRRCS